MMTNVPTEMNFSQKLKRAMQGIIPVLLVLMVFASFTMSIASLSKSVKTQRDVAALTEQFSKTTADLQLTMSAIEGHLAFMEKYMSDHHTFFYGDAKVTVNNRTKNR